MWSLLWRRCAHKLGNQKKFGPLRNGNEMIPSVTVVDINEIFFLNWCRQTIRRNKNQFVFVVFAKSKCFGFIFVSSKLLGHSIYRLPPKNQSILNEQQQWANNRKWHRSNRKMPKKWWTKEEEKNSNIFDCRLPKFIFDFYLLLVWNLVFVLWPKPKVTFEAKTICEHNGDCKRIFELQFFKGRILVWIWL